MPPVTPAPARDMPTEHLAGSVERVTFHSEETGFCVLRVKVRGPRDLVTVVGTAPAICWHCRSFLIVAITTLVRPFLLH